MSSRFTKDEDVRDRESALSHALPDAYIDIDSRYLVLRSEDMMAECWVGQLGYHLNL